MWLKVVAYPSLFLSHLQVLSSFLSAPSLYLGSFSIFLSPIWHELKNFFIITTTVSLFSLLIFKTFTLNPSLATTPPFPPPPFLYLFLACVKSNFPVQETFVHISLVVGNWSLQLLKYPEIQTFLKLIIAILALIISPLHWSVYPLFHQNNKDLGKLVLLYSILSRDVLICKASN